MVNLTDSQLRAYRAILAHYADTGGPPSLRDLTAALGSKSASLADQAVRRLRKLGLLAPGRLTKLGGITARSIVVPELADVTARRAREVLDALPASPDKKRPGRPEKSRATHPVG